MPRLDAGLGAPPEPLYIAVDLHLGPLTLPLEGPLRIAIRQQLDPIEVQGVVGSTTGTKVESHLVCTGEVKPHSTVSLDSPYRVGAVLEICNKTSFGDTKVVDWSKCSFDVVDVTAAMK